MTDTIVVGADGSVPSGQAIRWAAARAHGRGAKLELIHVLDHESTEADSRDTEAAIETLLRAGELIARGVADDIPISWRIARGDPLEVLSSTADEDLLVVGTHKTGFIRGTLFGSRFVALASRARGPVAYIPDLTGSIRAGVVVAVQDGDDDVIEFAAGEAHAGGQSLTLVNSHSGDPHEFEQEMAHAVVVAKSVDAELRVRTRRSTHPLAAALVEIAAHSTLLVVPHARDSATAALALDVLYNIASPTLVTRP